MPQRKGLVAPQNTFLDTIASRFDGTHSNFVLGNAQVRHHPIVYCSDGFVELTGFSRSQIMSRCCSCSFLWGEKTIEEAKESITSALQKKVELQLQVYFHKRSGENFKCLLDIVPIKNDKSQVVLFLVSHKDITTEEKMVDPQNDLNEDKEHKLTHRQPVQLVNHIKAEKGSFLSAGLATTITAAALGTASFRTNKLLDHIHARRSQLPRLVSPVELTNPSQRTGGDLLKGRITSENSCHKVFMNTALQSPTLPSMSQHRPSNPKSINVEGGVQRMEEPPVVHGTPYPHELQPDRDNRLLEQDSDISSDGSSDEPSTVYKYERRRSRAVLFHLSGRFDQNAKSKTNLKKFQTIPDYKVQDVHTSRFILLHYSIFRIVWDWMILICTFYIAIMVPYNAVFSLDTDGKDLLICDIIVELLFIIDIALNFATTFVSKSGQVVHETKMIAIHYIKGWFFLDLIAAIPFDAILAIHSQRESTGIISGVGSWIHLLKLARLLRLARLFQKIERYSQHSTVILGLLMCMFFLIAHWFACGWYWIGRSELSREDTQEYSWLVELGKRMRMSTLLNQSDGLTQRAIYVSSLYFATTSLTSVGFGNVSPNTVNEKVFSIIAMLIGALMHAAVFGNVTTLIQRMYARRSAYQTRNQDLKDFTRAHHIPKQLKQRMLEFFQAMWAINRGIDKEAILQSFPENVRGDIALHLNREMLSLPLFRTASPGCLKCLAQMIDTRFATPGEILINQGDILHLIFFVCSGSLEILDSEGSVVGLLGKCDIFGSDIDFWPTLGFSAYDVKSLTYCELQCITLDASMQNIMRQYPQFQVAFRNALHNELSFNLREGFEASVSSEILPAITLKQTADDSSEIQNPTDSIHSSIAANERGETCSEHSPSLEMSRSICDKAHQPVIQEQMKEHLSPYKTSNGGTNLQMSASGNDLKGRTVLNCSTFNFVDHASDRMQNAVPSIDGVMSDPHNLKTTPTVNEAFRLTSTLRSNHSPRHSDTSILSASCPSLSKTARNAQPIKMDYTFPDLTNGCSDAKHGFSNEMQMQILGNVRDSELVNFLPRMDECVCDAQALFSKLQKDLTALQNGLGFLSRQLMALQSGPNSSEPIDEPAGIMSQTSSTSSLPRTSVVSDNRRNHQAHSFPQQTDRHGAPSEEDRLMAQFRIPNRRLMLKRQVHGSKAEPSVIIDKNMNTLSEEITFSRSNVKKVAFMSRPVSFSENV
ncbi:unnamed protein product [Dicrocoelium dendriticum]|nr:unnamed protein product [Dicrocoelium dendriticum]